jgi:Ca2+-binding EF-hand superfamily protein
MSISAIGGSGSSNYLSQLYARNSSSRTGGANGPDFSKIAKDIISKEDADGNGTVSKSESKLKADVFEKFDADKNGSLTQDELYTGFKQGPPPGAGRPQFDASKIASKIIESEDKNGDGTVSAEESRLDSDLFKAFDTDSSGSLNADELAAGLEANKPSFPPGGAPPSGGEDGNTLKDLLEQLSRANATKAYGSQSQSDSDILSGLLNAAA